jgi:hypothetical protein
MLVFVAVLSAHSKTTFQAVVSIQADLVRRHLADHHRYHSTMITTNAIDY